MPADILLYALVAAGLIFWLRHILGTENDEDEKRPSIFSDDQDAAPSSNKAKDNIVNLAAVTNGQIFLPRHVRIDNKTTENKLDDIAKKYESFDLQHFVGGAEAAFQMVIEAFADGDLDTLRNLLAEPVYYAFEEVVNERKERGEIVETEIKSVEKMDITEANLQDDMLFITVRFTAREVCVIRNEQGEILSGNPERTTQMVDVWVFGREIEASTPEWHLYETRDDEVEDHKTPIPEAGSKKVTKKKAKKTPAKKTPKKD